MLLHLHRHPSPPLAAAASNRLQTAGGAQACIRCPIDAAGHDSSHDWWHVERVTKMAARLGAAEGLSVRESAPLPGAASLPSRLDHAALVA